MPDWSIKIVPSGTGAGAAFVPDLKGAKPGDPLPAQQDDLVTWNNTTKNTHQPWPCDEHYQLLPDVPRGSKEYLSDPIPAGGSSRPSYDVAQPTGLTVPPKTWKVYYRCKLHPEVDSERGTIAATAL
jgi:hypothetical protein